MIARSSRPSAVTSRGSSTTAALSIASATITAIARSVDAAGWLETIPSRSARTASAIADPTSGSGGAGAASSFATTRSELCARALPNASRLARCGGHRCGNGPDGRASHSGAFGGQSTQRKRLTATAQPPGNRCAATHSERRRVSKPVAAQRIPNPPGHPPTQRDPVCRNP